MAPNPTARTTAPKNVLRKQGLEHWRVDRRRVADLAGDGPPHRCRRAPSARCPPRSSRSHELFVIRRRSSFSGLLSPPTVKAWTATWSTPPPCGGSALGNATEDTHAFGDGVAGFAGNVDHHVEMQIQIAEVWYRCRCPHGLVVLHPRVLGAALRWAISPARRTRSAGQCYSPAGSGRLDLHHLALGPGPPPTDFRFQRSRRSR